jgi:DNA-binding HxlR family transcriptional regulator
VTAHIRPEDRECPLSATSAIVGTRWALLPHDAFDGFTRFDQFQRNLNISTSILTARLKGLVDAGILERSQYQASQPRDEYLLTERGRSLRPVVIALASTRTPAAGWTETTSCSPPGQPPARHSGPATGTNSAAPGCAGPNRNGSVYRLRSR